MIGHLAAVKRVHGVSASRAPDGLTGGVLGVL
jgi:hypothetical protein